MRKENPDVTLTKKDIEDLPKETQCGIFNCSEKMPVFNSMILAGNGKLPVNNT